MTPPMPPRRAPPDGHYREESAPERPMARLDSVPIVVNVPQPPASNGNGRVKLSSIGTVVGILVAVAGAVWAVAQSATRADLGVQVERVNALERYQARTGEAIEGIRRDIGEIKALLKGGKP